MDQEQLRKIAEYHAKNIRTQTEFLKVFPEPYKLGDYLSFVAMFKCKNGVKRMRQIVLDEDGNVIKII